jgi:hypothetical protein
MKISKKIKRIWRWFFPNGRWVTCCSCGGQRKIQIKIDRLEERIRELEYSVNSIQARCKHTKKSIMEFDFYRQIYYRRCLECGKVLYIGDILK